jgi:hypothetical protein
MGMVVSVTISVSSSGRFLLERDPKSPSGGFIPLVDLGGGFRIKTAVTGT